MAKKKRRHHYLPRFYVGGFANEQGRVFVFEHETKKLSEQSKEGTFHSPYFYSVDFSKYDKRDSESAAKIKKSLGLPDQTEEVEDHPDMIEDLLGHSENLAARIIPKLISGEHISDSEKIELSTFIALMYTRTPTFRNFTNELHKTFTEKHMEELFSSPEEMQKAHDLMVKEGYDKELDLAAIMSFFKEKKYGIEIPRELSIQNMLMVVPVIDMLLYRKTWFVIKACDEASFIASDTPVFMHHPALLKGQNPGFATPGVEVYFPLSQKAMLLMKDTPRGRMIASSRADRVRIRKMNKLIITNSGKYILSCSETLLRRLTK
jgi:hypothetical protein